MNKYEIAWEKILGRDFTNMYLDEISILVERATPKKVVKQFQCPSCGSHMIKTETPNSFDNNYYCGYCGQALKW